MKLPQKPFFSTAQAAQFLGVSIGTIQKMSERGQLSTWKTEGGHRRIAADSIKQILASYAEDKITKKENGNTLFDVILIEVDLALQQKILASLNNIRINLHIIKASNCPEGLPQQSQSCVRLVIIDIDAPCFIKLSPLTSLMNFTLASGNRTLLLTQQPKQFTFKIPSPRISLCSKAASVSWLQGYLTGLMEQQH